MGILRWAFAGLVALLVGLGFAVLTGSALLATVPAAVALLVVAYLSWEGRPLHQATREMGRRSPPPEAGYVAPFGGAADGGPDSGGDGGGASGGDGGAGGG